MTQQVQITSLDRELFGDKEARWYQIEARTRIVEGFKRKRNARLLLLAPTGTGKTMTGGMVLGCEQLAEVFAQDEDRPMRVVFMSHLQRLLTQAERAYAVESKIRVVTLNNLEGTSFGGHPVSRTDCVTEIIYATIGTDFSQLKGKVDMVLLDEGHHESCTTIQHHHPTFSDAGFVMMTATKDRLDRRILKYDEVIEPLTREDAVEAGYIVGSNLRTFVDLSGTDKTEIGKDILTNFAHRMGKTLIFVRTQQEVINLNQHLISLGYVSVGLTTQSPEEVNDILDALGEDRVQFIVNCKRLGEGIDVPGVTDVFICRTQTSYTDLNQRIGRTVRPDSESFVWELVNPLMGDNLDSTEVVGVPITHELWAKERGKWVVRDFKQAGGNNTIVGDIGDETEEDFED